MSVPFHEFFKAIEATPVGVFMRENVLAFPLVESIHVLALTIVVGTIGMIDLRLPAGGAFALRFPDDVGSVLGRLTSAGPEPPRCHLPA